MRFTSAGFSRRLGSAVMLLALVSVQSMLADPSNTPQRISCVALDIDAIGHPRLSTLLEGSEFQIWAELDDVLFACGPREALEGFPAVRHDLDPAELFITRGAHPGSVTFDADSVEVMATGGPYAIVRSRTDKALTTLRGGHLPGEGRDDHLTCRGSHVRPFEGQSILARQSANRPPRRGTVFGPEAGLAADLVDANRWFADVVTLAGWNRHTHGTQIDEARDWLVGQFSALPGLAVRTESFQVGGTTAENVIAVLQGSTRPNDWYLVGGHYDSTSENTSFAAPGAEDNASGCSGVLELARVMTSMPTEGTLIFLCYSGEEQGLHGSRDHAERLFDDGDDAMVRLMLNMDMIGYTGDADLDSLLETEPEFAEILEPFEDAATAFTTLRTITSLFAFGSDHVPYLDRGMPALLTIQNDWDSYPSYHRTHDLPANLDLDMGHQTLRMNAAVLAHQAGASAAASLVFGDGFESGNLSAWTSNEP